MRTIDITEAQSWKQTLIDVAQTIQDKAAINGKLSEWDERVYNEVVEIEKKLDLVEPEIPMKEVKRFDLVQLGYPYPDHGKMIEREEGENGEWIRFSDYSQFTTQRSDQRQATDEEIDHWAFEYVKDVYNNLLPNEGDSMPFDSGDFQLWLNLMVEAAKAMRDGLIKSNRK